MTQLCYIITDEYIMTDIDQTCYCDNCQVESSDECKLDYHIAKRAAILKEYNSLLDEITYYMLEQLEERYMIADTLWECAVLRGETDAPPPWHYID